MRQGKLKINNWEKLLQKMQVAFLPHKYTLGRQSQNLKQEFKAVTNFLTDHKKEVFREIWSKAKSPQQANWTSTCQPQIHKPNPYSVKVEQEYVDGEF